MTNETLNTVATVTFSNGVEVLNCTPHEIRFQDGDEIITVAPCGATLKSNPQEKVVSGGTPIFVKAVFVGSPEGEEEIALLKSKFPKALLIGSIISAQAYPGLVVGMVPAVGFERVAPADKLMRTDKYTIF